VEKYGVWAALFSWAPLVGDLIAIALGLMRINPWKTLLVMFVGKTLRYVVTANLLGLTGWF
jgi:membrane protein YqaA with SNARE-associated domain